MTFLDEDAFASDSYPFDFDLSAKMTLMDLLAAKGEQGTSVPRPDICHILLTNYIFCWEGFGEEK